MYPFSHGLGDSIFMGLCNNGILRKNNVDLYLEISPALATIILR